MNMVNDLRNRVNSVNMSVMRSSSQDGGMGSIVTIVLLVFLLLIAVGFGVEAYSGEQHYKTQTDAIVQQNDATTKSQTQATDSAKYAEEAKQPLQSYVGPAAFGSITIWFPKTWSAYIDDSNQGSGPLIGYFDPGVVPSINTTQKNLFALRVQLLSQTYDTTLQNFDLTSSNGAVTITSSPFAFPKVPSVVGVRLVGEIEPMVQGDMIIVPLRDQTLEVWTESTAYESDLNNFIIPNFSFSP